MNTPVKDSLHTCAPLAKRMSQGKSIRMQRGFTLIELLLVLAILGLLAGVSIPSFYQSYMNRREFEIATQQAIEAIRRARELAVTQALPHTLEFSNHPTRGLIYSRSPKKLVREIHFSPNTQVLSEMGRTSNPSIHFREDGATEGMRITIKQGALMQQIEVTRRCGTPQMVAHSGRVLKGQ